MMRRYVTHATIIIIGFVLLLSFVSCNQDGVGIFYNVATEVKLNDSKISELPVHQVIELDSKVYVRTGGTVWKGDKNGGGWSEIAKGNVSSIARSNTKLYAVFYKDNLAQNKFRVYEGGNNWRTVEKFNNDGTVIGADDHNTYAAYLVHGKAADNNKIDATGEDDSNFSSISSTGVVNEVLIDAVRFNGTDEYFTISKETMYKSGVSTPGSLSELSISENEDFTALAYGSSENGNDYIFYGTAEGTVEYSTDGISFSKLESIGEEIVSMDTVDFDNNGSAEFLIVGTNNGYQEADISGTDTGWNLRSPSSATADASGSSEFAAAYPDLAYTYVFDVQRSHDDNGEFYLATGNGLWKRNTDGSFSKM